MARVLGTVAQAHPRCRGAFVVICSEGELARQCTAAPESRASAGAPLPDEVVFCRSEPAEGGPRWGLADPW